jgi:hypothetical protein
MIKTYIPTGFSRSQLLKSSIVGGFFIAGLIVASDTVRSEQLEMLSPGLYQLEMIMASTTRIRFFGTSKSASKSLSLVEIRHDAEGFQQSHKVCDFRLLEDSAMIKIVFPEKFISALANHTYPIQLERDGPGWRYRADLGFERIGYKASPGDDKLPNRIDDPAVYDWDGDGRPGATLKLSVPLLPDGELYVVQRGHSILNGRLTRPGYVEGFIDYIAFEQRVLAARPAFLSQSPEITPNPNESRFTITPLPPGSTCETVKRSDAIEKGLDSAR